jgi:hypothetical protein
VEYVHRQYHGFDALKQDIAASIALYVRRQRWNRNSTMPQDIAATALALARHHLLPVNGSSTLFKSNDSTYLLLNVAASPNPTISFNGGSVWSFGCTSLTSQPDGGTMYPRQLQTSITT